MKPLPQTDITDEQRYDPSNYLTAQQRRVCLNCGRSLKGTQFYMFPNGKQNQRAYICADCMAATIDISDTESFYWICEYFDIPYVVRNLQDMIVKELQEKGEKATARAILGKYIRQMKANAFGGLRFSDTKFINLDTSEDLEELIEKDYDGDWSIVEKYEQELTERYESGTLKSGSFNAASLQKFTRASNNIDRTIPAEEFKKNISVIKTSLGINEKEEGADGRKFSLENLSKKISTKAKEDAANANTNANDITKIIYSTPPPTTHALTNSEDLISSQLTDEDITYLTSKWGATYTPSDWVKMEEIYNSYVDSFDMTIDREETLKKLIKTSIKMDAALESNDMTGFKALSAVYDQLRKSGKFTDSQKQDEKDNREIDSIGELVYFIEKEGDIIPPLPAEDYEQDKIDLIIKDMQAYTYNLLKNEMGLNDLIESYIKKLEEIEKESKSQKDLTDGLITSEKDLLKSAEITDEEIDAIDPWAEKLDGQDFSTQDLLDTF